ncbi:MAG TPA: tetratricopeptide repeat protein [Casimicrobiaceae bacterium]
MGHFLRGHYDEACRAAYRSVQANPAHSITYVQLAAALTKLGRMDEARAAAKRVLELGGQLRCGMTGIGRQRRLFKRRESTQSGHRVLFSDQRQSSGGR